MAERHALFADAEAAGVAVERLVAAGVSPADIEVRSSVPLDPHRISIGVKARSSTPWLAVGGGILGGIGAYLLATRPPPIGNLPAAAGPPVAVIAFEGIAIGAILFTVASVLVECGLPRLTHRPGPFDGELAEGKIVVTVRGAQDPLEDWAAGAAATARTGAG